MKCIGTNHKSQIYEPAVMNHDILTVPQKSRNYVRSGQYLCGEYNLYFNTFWLLGMGVFFPWKLDYILTNGVR